VTRSAFTGALLTIAMSIPVSMALVGNCRAESDEESYLHQIVCGAAHDVAGGHRSKERRS